MPTQTLTDQIRQAEAHITDGAYGDALTLLHEVLSEDATNTDALNDAAIAYKEMGDVLEAVKCLEAVLQLDPTHSTAFFNLLDTLALTDDLELVIDAYLRYEEQIPDTEEKVRYAEKIQSAGNRYMASSKIGQRVSGKASPSDATDTSALKIAFVCNWDHKFIDDLETELADRHHVRAYHFEDKIDLGKVQEAMDWADVTWFEWCNQLIVEASQKLRKSSAVVCRLHRYEAFTKMPSQVRWDFVDTLIPTSKHIRETLFARHNELEEGVNIQVVPSAVNTQKYSYTTRSHGFNIAYIGYLHHRKNPYLLLESIRALRDHDARYNLHIAGYFQQPVWEHYFEYYTTEHQLNDNITLHGWIDDASLFLEPMNYLILPSIHEGNPYSVLEAMSMGIKPLVHNFPGAKEIYHRDWLFTNPQDLIQIIESFPYTSSKYRKHVEDNFSLSKTSRTIEDILRSSVDTSRHNLSLDLSYNQRYHDRNRFKVKAMADAASKSESLLDIGCNSGYASKYFLENEIAQQATGVELSRELINDDLYSTEGFRFFQGSIVEFDFSESYDIVIYNAVHHHLFNNYGPVISDLIWDRIVRSCNRELFFEIGSINQELDSDWKSKLSSYYQTDYDVVRVLFGRIGPRLESIEILASPELQGARRNLYKLTLRPHTYDSKQPLLRDSNSYPELSVEKTLLRTVGSSEQQLVEGKRGDANLAANVFQGTQYFILSEDGKTYFSKKIYDEAKSRREILLHEQTTHPRVAPLRYLHPDFGLVFDFYDYTKLPKVDWSQISNRAIVRDQISDLFSFSRDHSVNTGILDLDPSEHHSDRPLIDIIDMHPNNFIIDIKGSEVIDWKFIDLEYYSNDTDKRNRSFEKYILSLVSG